jgi:hypothetical protein
MPEPELLHPHFKEITATVGTIVSWVSLVVSTVGLIYIYRNYKNEKKKRILSIRPIFIRVFEENTDKRIDNEENSADIKIQNVGGETAIVNFIYDTQQGRAIFPKNQAIAKDKFINLRISLKSLEDGSINKNYHFKIVFTDIEGRWYKQTIMMISNRHHEHLPVKSKPGTNFWVKKVKLEHQSSVVDALVSYSRNKKSKYYQIANYYWKKDRLFPIIDDDAIVLRYIKSKRIDDPHLDNIASDLYDDLFKIRFKRERKWPNPPVDKI